jgi:nucleoside-diphosphate-sugar epimerase
MKLLITGCSGYIGSHLVKILKSNPDYEIHGLDFRKSQIETDTFLHQNITFNHHWNINEE